MKYCNLASLTRAIRSNLEMTQAEFSTALGLKTTRGGAAFVSNCERGITYIPLNRWKTLVKESSQIKKGLLNDVLSAYLKDVEIISRNKMS